jgi:hypothetical protein
MPALDESTPGCGPIEVPHPLVLPETIRRHRTLTGPAGIILFGSMFLPVLRGFDPPDSLVMLPFLPPYLYGLAFAMIALTRTPRGLARGAAVLRALATFTALAGCLLALVVPLVGMAEVLVALVALVVIGLRGGSERRSAGSAVVVGAISTAWFAAWASSSDAMLGTYVAVSASVGLLFGGLVWLVDLATQPTVYVPRAVVRE